MKRLTAFLLTLVMLVLLLPAGTVANAEATPDAPFYCVNMSVPGDGVPYFYSMPFFWTREVTPDTVWPYVSWNGIDSEYDLAVALKEDFNNRPEGARYFQLTLVQKAKGKIEKVVYYDEFVEFIRDWVVDFLKIYKSIGGELDGIIVDLEYNLSQGWYLHKAYRNGNTNVYKDIINDPRYETDIKPRIAEMGFDFSLEGTANTELWTLQYYNMNGSINEKYNATNEGIWNHVMTQMQREAINESVLYPLLEYYPDATVSDYQSGTFDPWHKALGIHGGPMESYVTESAGNVSNYNTYAGYPQIAFFGTEDAPLYNTIPGHNGAVYEAKPFNKSQYDVNLFKNMYASTDDGMIDVWIAQYNYGVGEPLYNATYSCTPYYSETLYHLGLLNPQVFLGYLTEDNIISKGSTLKDAVKTASDVLVELNRLVGFSDRKPIQTQASWNGGYILSGMYANGRNVWRLTPDTDMVSLADFKVEGTDPTFSVGGLTITFPQGKIIEDGEVYEAGSCGYWIETPKDIEPVITSTADRYRNYPSLEETFEGYTAGSAFTSAAALPKTCWNVTGTAAIQANGDGKALALTGSTTVQNVKLPQNITAGDEYAKQQAWEVTVTLPDGLNDSAVIKLLGCTQSDLGFKITDGKVYYDKAGTYQQLDGVTLGAGTYTFRREVDFRTEGSFTSDYAIYDASGKLLGEAKDVAMQSFTLPVTTITMAVIDARSAVLLDDYKLYPTGFTTVLEAYDAVIGTKLTDPSAARTENTAYRLSWLNATADPMIAYIYDSISGKIIDTIGITPGMDGVIAGVVEVEAGKSVQLAVKTEKGVLTTPGGDTEQGGNTDVNPPSGGTDATVPSGGTDGNNPTGGADGNTPTGGADVNPPSGDPGSTDPGTQEPGDKDKMGGGMIALIVVLSLAILGGVGFAVYWFIIKPRLAAKPTEDTVSETDETSEPDAE